MYIPLQSMYICHQKEGSKPIIQEVLYLLTGVETLTSQRLFQWSKQMVVTEYEIRVIGRMFENSLLQLLWFRSSHSGVMRPSIVVQEIDSEDQGAPSFGLVVCLNFVQKLTIVLSIHRAPFMKKINDQNLFVVPKNRCERLYRHWLLNHVPINNASNC